MRTMPLRDFRDSQGTQWTVWSVAPSFTLLPSVAGAEGQPLDQGWLCFESDTEKRRLAPVPEQWEKLDAGALGELLARAHPVARRGG